MSRRQSLRRNLEMWTLRFQARLDSPWSDRVLPWVIAGVSFVVLGGLSLARYRSFDNGVELARHVQAAWKIGQGVAPGVGVDGQHFLAQQAAVLFLPIGWVVRFFPIGPALLLVQAAFLALGVVPLWRVARNLANLRVGATLTLAFAYVVYPAIHNVNLADFHLESVAPVALLGAIYNGIVGRWWRYAAFVLVVLAARADLSLAIMGLGALLAVEGHRRAGALTTLAGVAWLVFAFAIVQSTAGDGVYPHVDAFARWGDTPWGSMWGLVTRPVEVLEVLFSQQSFRRLMFLLAPLLFLPMVAPRYLLPIVPLEALYLLSDVPPDEFGNPEQDMAITAFLFVGAAFALSQAGRIRGKRTLIDPRVLGAIVLTSAVFFVNDALSTPYNRPWAWHSRDASDLAVLSALEDLPDGALVRASPTVLPHASERLRAFKLDTNDAFVRAEEVADGVNVVILDLAEAPLWDLNTVINLTDQLDALGFDRASAVNDIFVFKRTRLPGE